MVTCPWCGTSYAVFQSSCSRCGGPIQAPEVVEAAGEVPLAPSEAPRPISDSYALKLMGSDGWAIAGLVFLILGIVFTPLGLALTLPIVNAFVGLPFLILGLVFLMGGVGVLIWRYQVERQQVQILKWGEATLGRVTDLQENVSLEVNGRHPWNIDYQYEARGQTHTGRVTTLSRPGDRLQPGRRVYVLYMGGNPTLSSLYPHP
jgi:hypothetical protein